MKELSTEIITINGVDYTLFLNRKGVVAFEQYSKTEKDKILNIYDKYTSVDINNSKDFNKLNDDADPFDGINELDNANEDILFLSKIYKRLYWIMLYTHHKLSISEASKLYDEAVEEYGVEQLIALGQQMIQEINTNPYKELKNLKALKPKKN